MWDLIVSVPDHCLSFYFAIAIARVTIPLQYPFNFKLVHMHTLLYLLKFHL